MELPIQLISVTGTLSHTTSHAVCCYCKNINYSHFESSWWKHWFTLELVKHFNGHITVFLPSSTFLNTSSVSISSSTRRLTYPFHNFSRGRSRVLSGGGAQGETTVTLGVPPKWEWNTVTDGGGGVSSCIWLLAGVHFVVRSTQRLTSLRTVFWLPPRSTPELWAVVTLPELGALLKLFSPSWAGTGDDKRCSCKALQHGQRSHASSTDRGRCYYWRQMLGETSSSHMIVFQPRRLDTGIMGWIPLGNTTELYGCYLLQQPQKLNWYFFKQA